MKICMTIAGLDPSGGAGIIADVKTFSAFGCFATSAISSITFQNTQGVFGAQHQTAESIRKQIEPILDDFEVAAVKTGMLPTPEVIHEVARIINENAIEKLVVDPVVCSTSGFDLIDDDSLHSLIKKLFPLSLLVTPNIPEAERITGTRIENAEDIKKAARRIRDMGARSILIKGGHFANFDGKKPQALDYLFIGNKLEVFEAEFIETNATHGTGCTLASAITANLALGRNLVQAVGIAKEFVYRGIKNSPKIGKGNSPIRVE